jgi:hypothetical protein
MSKRVLDDKYIIAIKAIWETGLFNLTEIGKIFYINRSTVKRYIDLKADDLRSE